VRWNSYQRDEIIGKPEDMVAGTNAADTIHPDDRAFIQSRIANVLEIGIQETVEGRVLLAGGPEFRWLLMTGRQMMIEGRPFLIGIGIDITERKRAELELMESKALVDAVVENVPLMIFLKEAEELRFVLFNRAGEENLGYDRKDLLGKNNLDLFPPEQAAHFMARDREVLDGETGVLDIPEEPILTNKKGQRLLHTRKVCIRGGDGATKYLLCNRT
jgi:two-component system cell cycle sensor histidine kinase/response regulator CckA